MNNSQNIQQQSRQIFIHFSLFIYCCRSLARSRAHIKLCCLFVNWIPFLFILISPNAIRAVPEPELFFYLRAITIPRQALNQSIPHGIKTKSVIFFCYSVIENKSAPDRERSDMCSSCFAHLFGSFTCRAPSCMQ